MASTALPSEHGLGFLRLRGSQSAGVHSSPGDWLQARGTGIQEVSGGGSAHPSCAGDAP